LAVDHWVKIRHLFQGDWYLHRTIFIILHHEFGLIKKSVWWVPKLLTQEQKHERAMISQECLLTTPTHQIWLMMAFFLSSQRRESNFITSASTSFHCPDSDILQRHPGTGYQNHHHWRIRRRLPPMFRANQKGCAHQRWLCGEIMRSNYFSNYKNSC
jgi:hypothetical protein